MTPRPTVGLIDADILVYKYGHACTDRVQWTPESEVVSWCCIERAKELIAAKLKLMYAKHRAGTLMTDYDLSEVPEYQRERLTATLAKCLNELTS